MSTQHDGSPSLAEYCYLVHDQYGCDSGCCGHRAYLVDREGNIIDEAWEFTHPYGTDHESWTKGLLAEFWPDVPIKWEECQVYGD